MCSIFSHRHSLAAMAACSVRSSQFRFHFISRHQPPPTDQLKKNVSENLLYLFFVSTTRTLTQYQIYFLATSIARCVRYNAHWTHFLADSSGTRLFLFQSICSVTHKLELNSKEFGKKHFGMEPLKPRKSF